MNSAHFIILQTLLRNLQSCKILATFWYYDTGLSDFHKLTFTVLKMFYAKQRPRVIKYRDYKDFYKITFRMDLLKELSLSNLQKETLINLSLL